MYLPWDIHADDTNFKYLLWFRLKYTLKDSLSIVDGWESFSTTVLTVADPLIVNAPLIVASSSVIITIGSNYNVNSRLPHTCENSKIFNLGRNNTTLNHNSKRNGRSGLRISISFDIRPEFWFSGSFLSRT